MATQSLNSGFTLYLKGSHPSALASRKPNNISTLLLVRNGFSLLTLTTQNVPDFPESLSKPPCCGGRRVVLRKLQNIFSCEWRARNAGSSSLLLTWHHPAKSSSYFHWCDWPEMHMGCRHFFPKTFHGLRVKFTPLCVAFRTLYHLTFAHLCLISAILSSATPNFLWVPVQNHPTFFSQFLLSGVCFLFFYPWLISLS